MYIDISNVSMEIFVESLDLKNSQKNSSATYWNNHSNNIRKQNQHVTQGIFK